MFWLTLVLFLGCLIVLLDYTLESIIFRLEHLGLLKTTCQEWSSNDTLQLQRIAHEELGLGDWEGCVGSRAVPVTSKGQLLGVLDCKDPTHPRLMKPPPAALEEPGHGHGDDSDKLSNDEGKIENANTSVQEKLSPPAPTQIESKIEPPQRLFRRSSEQPSHQSQCDSPCKLAPQTQPPVRPNSQSITHSAEHLQDQFLPKVGNVDEKRICQNAATNFSDLDTSSSP